MQTQLRHSLVSSFNGSLEPIDTRPLYDWAHDHVTLPPHYGLPGKFDVSISPHVRKPMDSLLDNRIRQINFAASVQTFKSGINELYIPYIILQSPGNTLRVHSTDPMAQACVKTRILPMLMLNKKTKALLENATYNEKDGLLVLPTMFLKSCGTSINNLQSLSIKNLILEEVAFYQDNNVIEEAIARTSFFANTRKIIVASQPDMEGSALWLQYNKGTVYEWGWRCKHCGTLQQYELNGQKDDKYHGLIWSPNNKGGTLSYDERTNDTRMICQVCHSPVMDTERDRLSMVMTGDYIKISDGQSDTVSYSWPCYVNKDRTFKSVALEYLSAKYVWDHDHIHERMQQFYNKTLGKFWARMELQDVPKLLQTITTDGTSTWADETFRFLTLDVQQNCIYWLLMAWSNKVPESRLIDWGLVNNFDDIQEVMKKYNVHPQCVGVDSGCETRNIYKESVIRGEWRLEPATQNKKFYQWICLKGDGGKFTPKISYTHTLKDGTKIQRYYSELNRAECNWEYNNKYRGMKAKLYLFSAYSLCTILANIRDGKMPFNFVWNQRANEEFAKQIHSEELDHIKQRWVAIRDDNHLWDCLKMQLVLAMLSGCYIPAASITGELLKKQMEFEQSDKQNK